MAHYRQRNSLRIKVASNGYYLSSKEVREPQRYFRCWDVWFAEYSVCDAEELFGCCACKYFSVVERSVFLLLLLFVLFCFVFLLLVSLNRVLFSCDAHTVMFTSMKTNGLAFTRKPLTDFTSGLIS